MLSLTETTEPGYGYENTFEGFHTYADVAGAAVFAVCDFTDAGISFYDFLVAGHSGFLFESLSGQHYI